MRRASSISLIVLGITTLVLLVSWWASAQGCLGLHRVKGLGNFEESVRRLPGSPRDCFRFAILGDPEEGLGVYRDLMKKARDMGAAFVVIPGDLADRPTREAFELFNHEQQSLGSGIAEGGGALPTFVAIGNHDVASGHLFEEYYGPTQFHFIHAGSLFIFAENNAPDEHGPCGLYVEDVIARYRKDVSRVFIVVHKPITDYRKWTEERHPGARSQYLYDILDRERVDAVIAGHLHGYDRQEYRGALLLVTGGAGGKLQGRDAFHHMVLVDVGPGGITETVVRTDATNTVADDLRLAFVVRLYPFIFGSTWRPVLALGSSGALLLVGMGLWRRRRPSLGAHAGGLD